MLIPEEEAPWEEDLDGDTMVEDEIAIAVMQEYLLLLCR